MGVRCWGWGDPSVPNTQHLTPITSIGYVLHEEGANCGDRRRELLWGPTIDVQTARPRRGAADQPGDTGWVEGVAAGQHEHRRGAARHPLRRDAEERRCGGPDPVPEADDERRVALHRHPSDRLAERWVVV